MKLRQSQATKLSLSTTMRSWLPILQADIESLEEVLEPFEKENPFIKIKSGYEKSYQNSSKSEYSTNSIESLNFYEKSLYDMLNEQINPPLFPTKKSQNIAYEIIENIDENGYFVGDLETISKKLKTGKEDIERVRMRFGYLEPVGVGAKDIKESFIFQLNDLDIEEPLFSTVVKLIENIEHLEDYCENSDFKEALRIIKKFKNPPAIEFAKESKQIIPDIFIEKNEKGFEVQINNSYYPDVILDIDGIDKKEQYIKDKIKGAKTLIDALNMRKATLRKIGLMILEYQYEFFTGGDIMPMKLKDLAYELERNPSTISRAISNKYLSCSRGVIPLKNFFSIAIEENVSNISIKSYIKEVIKNEDKNRPLSDEKISKLIEKKFNTKIVRRTVTKYRKQMSVGGSSERKKLYQIGSKSV